MSYLKEKVYKDGQHRTDTAQRHGTRERNTWGERWTRVSPPGCWNENKRTVLGRGKGYRNQRSNSPESANSEVTVEETETGRQRRTDKSRWYSGWQPTFNYWKVWEWLKVIQTKSFDISWCWILFLRFRFASDFHDRTIHLKLMPGNT